MIPVFRPEIGEEEAQAVAEAVRRGEISGSFGQTIPEFEQKFATYVGVKHGIAVTSGTTALHLAVAAAGIGSEDEVLVSASTNIASALAVYHAQAITVPVDVEPDTWNMDPSLIEPLISSRTKAILPVHLYGHPVDMRPVMAIAKKYRLIVIEDCAESHGATYRNRMTGSFGDMGCFSFYANKIMTTGEGGMITTNNDALAEKLRLMRNLAFTKPRFRHEVPGFNFRMTGYQAAMGLVQIKKIETIIERKRHVAHTYTRLLSDIPGLQLPVERDWARNVYWMYGVVVSPEFGMSRDALMEFLHKKGVETRTFFCPMNQQPFLRKQKGFRDAKCPVADKLWLQGLYLPSSACLNEHELSFISDCIKKAYAQGA